MISLFVSGFGYFFKGFSVIGHNPPLWKFILVPLGINAAVFGGGLVLFLAKLNSLLDRFVQKEGLWSAFLYYILAVILILSFVVVAFYLFTVIGNLIAAPFNAVLSERTERLVAPSAERSGRGMWRDAAHAVATEIKKIVLLIAFFIPILLINLLPVVGQILSVLVTLLYTSLAMSFNFMDYAMERHHTGFLERYRIVLSRKPLAIGFGTACFLFGIIPLINLVMIPVCVTAGTLLYHAEFKPGLTQPRRTPP